MSLIVRIIVVTSPGLLPLVCHPVPVLPHLPLPVVRRLLPRAVRHQVSNLPTGSTSSVIGRGSVSQQIAVEEIILQDLDLIQNSNIHPFTNIYLPEWCDILVVCT